MHPCKFLAPLCVLVTLLLAGCGSSKSTVSGKVTLDGKPLTKGDVAFYSGSGAALAIGQINSSGNYQLQTGTDKGLQPGSYQVTIVANDVVEPTQPFASPTPKLLTPARYSNAETSGLTAEVKPGSNRFDFDLTSEPAEKSEP